MPRTPGFKGTPHPGGAPPTPWNQVVEMRQMWLQALAAVECTWDQFYAMHANDRRTTELEIREAGYPDRALIAATFGLSVAKVKLILANQTYRYGPPLLQYAKAMAEIKEEWAETLKYMEVTKEQYQALPMSRKGNLCREARKAGYESWQDFKRRFPFVPKRYLKEALGAA